MIPDIFLCFGFHLEHAQGRAVDLGQVSAEPGLLGRRAQQQLDGCQAAQPGVQVNQGVMDQL
jgi:hypothetical protein